MDAERQPLLGTYLHARYRQFRPLNQHEVQTAQNDASWRRARICVILMFWAIMAMFLSIITCILVTTTKCRKFDVDQQLVPSVPPVHMSFTPLLASGKTMYNHEYPYAL